MIEYPKIETIFDRRPDFTVDTDKLRLPEIDLIKSWVVTEKIDGTNIRVVIDEKGEVHFGGRTDAAQIPAFLVEHLIKTFTADKMKALWQPKKDGSLVPYEIQLFGEGYGEKIQKGGGNYRPGVSFRLFDVLVSGRWWLDLTGVSEIAERLGINIVPVIGVMTAPDVVAMIRRGDMNSVVAEEERKTVARAEGVVCRTNPLLFMGDGKRLMWKLKLKDFIAGKR